MTAAPEAVLLHGVGLDHTMWDRVVPDLVAAGLTVHAPDLLGHGTAAIASPATTLTDIAAPVATLASGAASPVHLVGFSLGGLVATRVALDRPDRVASLTLISSVANRSETQRRAVADRLDAARRDLSGTFDAAIERWFSPRWRQADQNLVTAVRNTLQANDPESYRACYAVFASADAELWEELPGLVPPVWAVTGTDDPGSTPRMSEAVANRVPHGRCAAIPGARHLLPLECPDAVVAAVLNQTHARPFDLAGVLSP